MIINPLERFSKNDLNKEGWKLAFLDTSILNRKFLHEEIVKELKGRKIRLVVNLFVLHESLKGLNTKCRSRSRYRENIENKKLIMKFLDDAECLYLIDFQHILSYELVHAYHKQHLIPHEFFKVFSKCPIGLMSSDFRVKYDCDLLLKFYFNPYEETCSYEGWFEGTLKEREDLSNIWKKEIEEIYKGSLRTQQTIKNAQLNLPKDEFQQKFKLGQDELLREWVEKFIPNHTEIAPKKLTDLVNKLQADIATDKYLSCAPLVSLQYYIFLESTKKDDSKEKKKGNNFMDRMHTQNALSYCDYFVSNDEILKQNCSVIIKDMGLKVKIMNSDFKELKV